MRFRVYPTAQALAEAAADEVEAWLNVPGGRRTIGLAGGSTPRLTYEVLQQRSIRWRDVHAWMTDERHVPATDPESNARMARRALFDFVPATLHEVPWMDDARAAADAYEKDLDAVLPVGPSGLEPGLIMLGVGEDGHTASLFPGSSALNETDRNYVATLVEGRRWRLTATRGLLGRARRTLFLVAGSAKSNVVAELLAGSSDLPAAVVARSSCDPVWLLDAAAAASLDE